LIYVSWTLAAPTGALAALLLLMTVAGKPLSAATPAWRALLAAIGVFALPAWAWRVATAGERPGMACGIVVLSWVLFALAMFVNGIARQKLWN
jgi:hypothetical protein